jgi:hypothetical protein
VVNIFCPFLSVVWIGIVFESDPDPDPAFPLKPILIRIQLFHPNAAPDPDPAPLQSDDNLIFYFQGLKSS